MRGERFLFAYWIRKQCGVGGVGKHGLVGNLEIEGCEGSSAKRELAPR